MLANVYICYTVAEIDLEYRIMLITDAAQVDLGCCEVMETDLLTECVVIWPIRSLRPKYPACWRHLRMHFRQWKRCHFMQYSLRSLAYSKIDNINKISSDKSHYLTPCWPRSRVNILTLDVSQNCDTCEYVTCYSLSLSSSLCLLSICIYLGLHLHSVYWNK